MTIIPLRYWVALIAGLLISGNAKAEPMYFAEADGATVTLHSEPCALTDVVTNLPRRATWSEKGKTFEGCWSARPDIGIVVLYFSGDKTVGLAPMQAFQRAVNS